MLEALTRKLFLIGLGMFVFCTVFSKQAACWYCLQLDVGKEAQLYL